MSLILDVLFPKSCTICSRKGTYLCPRCKKLFKRALPECYICRRLSSSFLTHKDCKKAFSLNKIFVCWEYNKLTSGILKKLKYQYTYDVSLCISEFFLESISSQVLQDSLKDSLITNIPSSKNRLQERGFNQTDIIAKYFSDSLKLKYSNNLLGRYRTSDHQALKDKEERIAWVKNDFFIDHTVKLGKQRSITIVDDVITTGITLEKACEVLRKHYGNDLIVNALCMFRGKAFYSDSTGVESS